MKTNPGSNAIQAFDKREKFSDFIIGNTAKSMMSRALPADASARLSSTLMSVVSSSAQLQQCKPLTILSASLRGEGMGLVYGHGYYIVPYGDNATFILSYKGMISLCLQTGKYADIDCLEVREGEYKGRNKRTGKPDIDFTVYADDETRNAAPVIGYYAYFELKDGYFRFEYWSIDKLLKHAVQYSRFSMKLYGELLDPKTDEKRKAEIKSKSLWYDIDGSQAEMFRKTCLRSLLNSGYAPMSNAVRDAVNDTTDTDTVTVESGGSVIGASIPDMFPSDTEIDEDTGEIIEATTVEATKSVSAGNNGEGNTDTAADKKRAQRATRASKEHNTADDEMDFFEGSGM